MRGPSQSCRPTEYFRSNVDENSWTVCRGRATIEAVPKGLEAQVNEPDERFVVDVVDLVQAQTRSESDDTDGGGSGRSDTSF